MTKQILFILSSSFLVGTAAFSAESFRFSEKKVGTVKTFTCSGGKQNLTSKVKVTVTDYKRTVKVEGVYDPQKSTFVDRPRTDVIITYSTKVNGLTFSIKKYIWQLGNVYIENFRRGLKRNGTVDSRFRGNVDGFSVGDRFVFGFKEEFLGKPASKPVILMWEVTLAVPRTEMLDWKGSKRRVFVIQEDMTSSNSRRESTIYYSAELDQVIKSVHRDDGQNSTTCLADS